LRHKITITFTITFTFTITITFTITHLHHHHHLVVHIIRSHFQAQAGMADFVVRWCSGKPDVAATVCLGHLTVRRCAELCQSLLASRVRAKLPQVQSQVAALLAEAGSDGEQVALRRDLQAILTRIATTCVSDGDIDRLIEACRAAPRQLVPAHVEAAATDGQIALAGTAQRNLYDSMHRELMVQELQLRDQQLNRLKEDLSKANNSKRGVRKSKARKHQQLVAVKDRLKDLQMRTDLRGSNKVKLTVHGGFSIAIALANSCGGARATVKCLDILPCRSLKSWSTVTMWEHRLLGAIRSVDLVKVQDMLEATVLPTPEAPGVDALEVFGYMSDSTNDEAVRKRKVHAAFIWALGAPKEVVSQARRGVSVEELAVQEHETMADLLIVQSGSGEELERMAYKEFMCVNVPHFADRTNQNMRGRASAYI